jgi:hypothetical protein
MGRLCYPTHPGRKAVSRNRGTKFLRPGKEGMPCPGERSEVGGTCFCSPGTMFIACWRDPGTSLNGVASLSPVTNFVAGICAVSRYKLSRSQKLVTVQEFNCLQMSESGCKNHYKYVLSAGAKQKP